MNLKNIYNNQLYERYNHPKHKALLAECTAQSGVYNPSCGDKISVQIIINNNLITTAVYQAQGCVISGGAADLICEYAINKTSDEIMNINKDIVFTIIGMQLGINRLRCAFITVEALQHAVSTAAEKQTVSAPV